MAGPSSRAEYSAAVIGAGPAGLSAALTLSRALQPTIAFDSPHPPRNAASPGFGGVLGRELTSPKDLQAVELADGAVTARQALVLWPFQLQTALVAALGVPLDDAGSVIVDDGYRTERPGVSAAGDLIYAGHQNVNTAIHMGAMAAAAMVLDISTTARG